MKPFHCDESAIKATSFVLAGESRYRLEIK